MLGVLGLALTAAIVAAVATAPAPLAERTAIPETGDDLDTWLAARESAVAPLGEIIPATAKRVRWYRDQRGSQTPVSVVYLHGFSASRGELAPVIQQVADALGANLFETRLAGHGLMHEALSDVKAEDWLDDGAEALAIGARLGEGIVLIGNSTGASLAMALADHPLFARVTALVQVSPNYGPRDRGAEWLTRPGGPLLALLVLGPTRSWEPLNEAQARYWTTSYPTQALVEMMRLVKSVRSSLPRRLNADLLVVYSPADEVVDPSLIEWAFERIQTPRKQLVRLTGSRDPRQHLLGGDIMSPESNQEMVERIVGFVQPNSIH